jgi:hypothetical protein
VHRADHGRVELRRRPIEAAGHAATFGLVVEQVIVKLVLAVARWRRLAPEQPGSRDESAADPLAELGDSVAREGRDDDLADP